MYSAKKSYDLMEKWIGLKHSSEAHYNLYLMLQEKFDEITDKMIGLQKFVDFEEKVFENHPKTTRERFYSLRYADLLARSNEVLEKAIKQYEQAHDELVRAKEAKLAYDVYSLERCAHC